MVVNSYSILKAMELRICKTGGTYRILRIVMAPYFSDKKHICAELKTQIKDLTSYTN